MVVFSAHLNEEVVGQVFVDDHLHHPVQQWDVGAGIERQMEMGQGCQGSPARIDDDQFSAAIHGGQHPPGDLGMGLGGVGAGNQDDLGPLDLVDRVGHRPAAEGGGQTGHGGGVSEAGAVVDVVGGESRPGEFLQEVVLLVGAFGRGEEGHAVGAVLIAHAAQLAGHFVEGGVPRDRNE